MPEVRNVFVAVADDYPDLEEVLGSRCKLVTNPEFESGMIKILEREECRVGLLGVQDKKKGTFPIPGSLKSHICEGTIKSFDSTAWKY